MITWNTAEILMMGSATLGIIIGMALERWIES